MKNVVNTTWLASHLDDPDVIVLDASHPAVSGQQPRHEGFRIAGARRFDIDYFSDRDSTLPHMLAPAATFEAKAQALGINQESHLVIYDNLGIYSSPRAWWMFKAMGHLKVSVLDGGLSKWVEEGHSLEKISDGFYSKGNFESNPNTDLVKSMEEIRKNIQTKAFQLIDARSSGRFDGTSPEPRPHLGSGHIEHSINIPFQEVLDDGCFRPKDELKQLFDDIDQSIPMVFSCGSGLTACIVMLAAELVSENAKAVYDGSWTEWASEEGNPIQK